MVMSGPERSQLQSPRIYLGEATSFRKASSKETLASGGGLTRSSAVPVLEHTGHLLPGKLGVGAGG